MKKLGFISDFYRNQIVGGAESNDENLISNLRTYADVKCFKSNDVTIANLEDLDTIIVSNFVLLSENIKNFLINNKKYIIYEHDHKYVKTRDPSKFINFDIPKDQLINVRFYEKAECVVVLSEICKNVMASNIPDTNIHSIGCSLWSDKKLAYIASMSDNRKFGFCIMKSNNPTKNYINTVRFCQAKNIEPTHISSTSHTEFLKMMSEHRTFIFLPTVLETFSRVCVEAKMLGLSTLTNKTNIGFYSEDYSNLMKLDLIYKIQEKQTEAYKFFKEIL
jgi:hypothetical protein